MVNRAPLIFKSLVVLGHLTLLGPILAWGAQGLDSSWKGSSAGQSPSCRTLVSPQGKTLSTQGWVERAGAEGGSVAEESPEIVVWLLARERILREPLSRTLVERAHIEKRLRDISRGLTAVLSEIHLHSGQDSSQGQLFGRSSRTQAFLDGRAVLIERQLRRISALHSSLVQKHELERIPVKTLERMRSQIWRSAVVDLVAAHIPDPTSLRGSRTRQEQVFSLVDFFLKDGTSWGSVWLPGESDLTLGEHAQSLLEARDKANLWRAPEDKVKLVFVFVVGTLDEALRRLVERTGVRVVALPI